MVSVIEKIGQADPNVQIPKEVKRLAAQANEAFRLAYPTKASDEPPVDPPKPSEVPPATPEPPKEPVVTPEATPPIEAPKETPPKEPGANWEHAYKSMKGRFDRSQAQLLEMSGQITALQGQITTLQAAPPVTKSASQPETLVTDEERDAYGADLLTVVGKKAREEFNPEFASLKSEISSLKSQLQGVTATTNMSAAEKLYATLDKEVPNWGTLNKNDEFLHYLACPDPYSGVIRHELLKQAHERHDAPRVLAFFKGFLAEEAATDPARSVSPDLTPSLVTNQSLGAVTTPGKVSLESLAAPGRAKSAAAEQAPTEKPFISTADIAGFYADVRANKYRGNDAEKNRIEAMIFEAQREGRIK